MTQRLFALERYDPGGESPPPGSAARLTNGPARLLAAVHLPADDTVLALVEAPDEEAVLAAAAAAGWRVDRLVPAAWIAPMTHQGEE